MTFSRALIFIMNINALIKFSLVSEGQCPKWCVCAFTLKLISPVNNYYYSLTNTVCSRLYDKDSAILAKGC